MPNYPSFDELLHLAQTDPEALERFRLEQVELLISQAPVKNQQRLRGLQFQIDTQRALHTNSPMGACLKMSQMMHESFSELRTWLNKITDNRGSLRSEINTYNNNKQSNAKVLYFPIAGI